MNTNIAIAAAVAVLIAGGAYYLLQDRPMTEPLVVPEVVQEETPTEVTETRDARGVVTNIDLEGMMVDGPGLITIRTDADAVAVIAIPSMGLPMCPAKEFIADLATITEGDTVSVRGEVNVDGRIMPCASVDHYLKIEG